MIRFCLSMLVLGLFTVVGLTLPMFAPQQYVDLTTYQQHSLNQTTQSLLKTLDSPLHAKLYTQNPDIKRQVTYFLDAIQTLHGIELSIEPQIPTPEEQEVLGFTTDGITFSYHNRSQSLNLGQAHLDELEFSKLLFKLSRAKDQWVVFMGGHGEPSIADDSSKGYSYLAKALKQQGLKTVQLDLPNSGFIADNTGLLVITNPKSDYLPKEITLIENYLKSGGAMLWLMDFQGKPLPFLSHLLGIRAHPGLIIDKKGYDMGTPHPAITIISQYPKDSLFTANQLTAYPWAQALVSEPKAAFSKQVILQTSEDSWTHTGDIKGEVTYTPLRSEMKGPLDLGYILKRKLDNKTQQIIVIGNHRFASNAAIQNYGNLSITLKAMNTLIEEPALANLAYNPPQDVLALLPKFYQQLYLLLIIIALPGLVLTAGFWCHLKATRKNPLGLA